jgi:hypothetical protein
MKTILKINLVLAIFVALSSVAFANPPVPTSGLIVPVDPAVDQNGNPIVDLVVYNSFCNPINPIVAPDGHQVTYCEWTKATGTATMQCEGNRGTRVTINASGLLPNGVYSAWVVLFGPGPAAPDGSNLLGVGPVGRPDGSQNVFHASAGGTAQLSVVTPASALGCLAYSVSTCLLSTAGVGEVQIHIAYHLDGQTHGSCPGGDCDFAVPLGFSFPR